MNQMNCKNEKVFFESKNIQQHNIFAILDKWKNNLFINQLPWNGRFWTLNFLGNCIFLWQSSFFPFLGSQLEVLTLEHTVENEIE